jgi:hypothetical protein
MRHVPIMRSDGPSWYSIDMIVLIVIIYDAGHSAREASAG